MDASLDRVRVFLLYDHALALIQDVHVREASPDDRDLAATAFPVHAEEAFLDREVEASQDVHVLEENLVHEADACLDRVLVAFLYDHALAPVQDVRVRVASLDDRDLVAKAFPVHAEEAFLDREVVVLQ